MTLYFFFGTECVHCHELDPLFERLEKEEGIKAEKFECWHNAANAKKLQDFDKGRCGAVPFCYNDKTGKFICGVCTYEKLKEWAKG